MSDKIQSHEFYIKYQKVPWDIGTPQPALTKVSNVFTGNILDIGAGLCNNSIWLSELKNVSHVTAVDISPEAINKARTLIQNSRIELVIGDVFNLPLNKTNFDVLLDSAFFHCIGDDDSQKRYLSAVTPRVKLYGRAVLLSFTANNTGPQCAIPRSISVEHARKMWTDAGWRVDFASNEEEYQCVGHKVRALLMVFTRVS